MAKHRYDRLRQLRAFCCAAELGSISRAAERLELTQPSVSLQIQSLERELGVILFERKGPRIRLTSEGQALHAMAQTMVANIDDLPTQFSKNSNPWMVAIWILGRDSHPPFICCRPYLSALWHSIPMCKFVCITSRSGIC